MFVNMQAGIILAALVFHYWLKQEQRLSTVWPCASTLKNYQVFVWPNFFFVALLMGRPFRKEYIFLPHIEPLFLFLWPFTV